MNGRHEGTQVVIELVVMNGNRHLTIEGLRAKRAYIGFGPIFTFCRIELIFGRPTCFDMKSIVP